MDKAQVIRIFEEMANILEIAEANPFEVMAYRNGARNLEILDDDLPKAVEEKSLTEIPGIGKGLSKVISDLVLTGKSREYDRLRSLFPRTLLDLLSVPGLGPKKIRTLHQKLGIDSLNTLEQAAREQKIRHLEGFGPKSEERIISGVDRARRFGRT